MLKSLPFRAELGETPDKRLRFCDFSQFSRYPNDSSSIPPKFCVISSYFQSNAISFKKSIVLSFSINIITYLRTKVKNSTLQRVIFPLDKLDKIVYKGDNGGGAPRGLGQVPTSIVGK